MRALIALSSLALALAAGFVTPASAQAASQTGGVEVVSSHTYAESGGLVLVGELRNDTGRQISLVKVAATFYDAAGRQLDFADGFCLLQQVLPGETCPFLVLTLSHEAEGYARYDLRLTHSAGFGDVVRDLEVVIDEVRYVDYVGWTQVSGHVTNTTGRTVQFNGVAFAFLDENGMVIAAKSGVAFARLAPGESQDFNITFFATIPYTSIRTWVAASPAR